MDITGLALIGLAFTLAFTAGTTMGILRHRRRYRALRKEQEELLRKLVSEHTDDLKVRVQAYREQKARLARIHEIEDTINK